MKLSKLIIPLMGLTSLTSANKQELLQLEKVKNLDVSYKNLEVENVLNYFDLAPNRNITENTIQNNVVILSNAQKNEIGKSITCPGGCEQMCDRVLHGCIDNCLAYSFFPPGCYVGCFTAYGICMAAYTNQESLKYVTIGNPKKVLKGKLVDVLCLALEFAKSQLQFLINRGSYTISETENGEVWKLEKKDPQVYLQEKISELKNNQNLSEEDKQKILGIMKESFGETVIGDQLKKAIDKK
ncbi:hypothetical protein C1645_834738 [Glomus cerebriforme]|uniref:Uncharacterized protein n=1 Tax=Glomus cerebriforme TaxID=658196 RepID=A0A397SFR3_9GLOM|nr:hypothetical protein C1645_834738 [Glomus cerebriforme]